MKRISGVLGLAAALVVPFALSACNSVDPGLGIQTNGAATTKDAATVTPPGALTGAPSTAVVATGQQPATQTASVTRQVRLNLAPIVGAPVAAVAPLSHRLQEDARTRGITINGDNDPTTTHVLKGYFSTLSEGGNTTVIYVWDVLDPSGNRLHRIQGQQQVTGTAPDPWNIVTPQTMATIGDQTVQALVQWINSSAT